MKKYLIIVILVLILLFPVTINAEESTCNPPYGYYEQSTGKKIEWKIRIRERDNTLSKGTYVKCEDIYSYYQDGYDWNGMRFSCYTSHWNNVGDDMSYIKETKGVGGCPSQFGIYICTNSISRAKSVDLSIEYPKFETSNMSCELVETIIRKDEPSEPEPKGSDKYVSVECKTGQYGYIKECGCIPSALTDLTKNIYLLLKIAAPALLLIIGGFDLIKAMSTQDEKAISKAQQKLLKKFVAAALVFLILVIVQTLVNILAADVEGTLKCLDYILNGYNG